MPQLEKIHDLLVRFLNYYHYWDFTAARVYFWGKRQPTFEKIGEFAFNDIAVALNELKICGLTCSYISKNTGYKMYHAKRKAINCPMCHDIPFGTPYLCDNCGRR
jgi:hypothetical protein